MKSPKTCCQKVKKYFTPTSKNNLECVRRVQKGPKLDPSFFRHGTERKNPARIGLDPDRHGPARDIPGILKAQPDPFRIALKDHSWS